MQTFGGAGYGGGYGMAPGGGGGWASGGGGGGGAPIAYGSSVYNAGTGDAGEWYAETPKQW
jgi:hypothetical protein